MEKLTEKQKQFVLKVLNEGLLPFEEDYIVEKNIQYNRIIYNKSPVSYKGMLEICSSPELGGSAAQATFFIEEWEKAKNSFKENPEEALARHLKEDTTVKRLLKEVEEGIKEKEEKKHNWVLQEALDRLGSSEIAF